MKKIAVLLAPGFEEVEAVAPVDVWRRIGFQVTLAAVGPERKVTGAHGMALTADASLADLDPAAFADQEKAEKLIRQRAELLQKIQAERKRLLEEDNGAKKLREEIMLLNRRLASLLETKKTMIELDSQLRELDNAISKLKPAPPPEPETEDAKKEDAGKADKADQADKADKEKKE